MIKPSRWLTVLPPAARVRLYRTLRTAHLERALELAPATIVYRARRYDFDERLTERLDLIRAGPLRTALLMMTSHVSMIEINEPLMRFAVRGTAVALAALKVHAAITRRHTTVVTYAIENHDWFRPQSGLRERISDRADSWLTHFVWRQVDRIVFGTPAAAALYEQLLPPPSPTMLRNQILPLPAACPCPTQVREPSRLIFLGAFSDRK
ncbi:MAG TPA: hypothetical protein VF635_15795, partial [Propionibacteriaceae bacterium]